MADKKDNNDPLEGFIRDNRDAFDHLNPPLPAEGGLPWEKHAQDHEDGLEAFVRNNRAAFDHLEPSAQLWNGIDLPKEATLEAFVANNRAAFDDREPGEKVWERIAKNLDHKVRTRAWSTVLWRAASVAAIVLSATAIWLQVGPDTGGPKIAENPVIQQQEVSKEWAELLEVEAYYDGMVNNKLQQFNQYAAAYPELRDELEYDMEDLDKAFLELKEELKEDLHNEDIIEAMIQNYRLKLKVLEDMLEQIQKPDQTSRDEQSEGII